MHLSSALHCNTSDQFFHSDRFYRSDQCIPDAEIDLLTRAAATVANFAAFIDWHSVHKGDVLGGLGPELNWVIQGLSDLGDEEKEMTERQYFESVIDRLHRNNGDVPPERRHFLPLFYSKRDMTVWELPFELENKLKRLDELEQVELETFTESNKEWISYQMHEGDLKRIQGFAANGELLSSLARQFARFLAFGTYEGEDEDALGLDGERKEELDRLLEVKRAFMETA